MHLFIANPYVLYCLNDLNKLNYLYFSVFWIDHPHCLRLITVNEEVLPQKVIDGIKHGWNVQNFVVKKENKDLVRAYVKHLINENITEKRNPLLFAIARANVIENIKNDVKLSKEIKLILDKVSKTEMFVNHL